MNGVMLYLMFKLDLLINLSWFLFTLFAIAPITISSIVWWTSDSQEDVKYRDLLRKFRFLYFFSLAFLLFAVFTPSTKQIAIIYVVPNMENSEVMRKMPKKMLLLSDEWLEDLYPEKILKDNGVSDSDEIVQ